MATIDLRGEPEAKVLQAIRERLDYNEETGDFIWSHPQKYSRMKVGDLAGSVCKTNGYLIICLGVDGVDYKLRGHHIAWFLAYGRWPTHLLDHKDRNRSNNKLSNLRPATDANNAQNRGVRRDSVTGVTGVTWSKSGLCYQVHITVDGDTLSIGSFNSFEAAKAARLNAEQFYFKEYAPSMLENPAPVVEPPKKPIRRDNVSGYPGVAWHKQNRKWAATISVNKVRKFLGCFLTPEEAYAARLKAEADLRNKPI